eukprot:c21470_g3_i1.p1 GENE.c21470_g3_i1~~c21470_g3_i1.p1  ORF type:complete len:1155 (-),score=486.10 c21470_g3_i1:38-3502(-)
MSFLCSRSVSFHCLRQIKVGNKTSGGTLFFRYASSSSFRFVKFFFGFFFFEFKLTMMKRKAQQIEEDEESEIEDSQNENHKQKKPKIKNDPSTVFRSLKDPYFKKGQIIKLQMQNFLTYDDATIYPGPYLNLVIGPNGTGKSTIVCGLCLVLGGDAKTLMRGEKLEQFVKHGKDEGNVEVVLSNGNGGSIVIQRFFKQGGKNTSVFHVNGKSVQKEHALSVVNELGIQVNNLCQFLPQDRVRDFGAMGAIELLRETERAILGKAHLDLHDELIAMQNSEGSDRVRYEQCVKEKNEVNDLCIHLELEVKRIQEKIKSEEFLKYLKRLIALKEVSEQKKLKDEIEKEAKKKKNEVNEKKVQLDALEGPLHPTKKKIADTETKIRYLKTKGTEIEKKMNDDVELFTNQEGEMELFRSRIEGAKSEEENRIKDIHHLKTSIEQLNKELETIANVDHREEIANIETQQNSLRIKLSQIQQHKDEKQQACMNIKQQLDVAKERRTRIADPRSQCVNRLLDTLNSPILKQDIQKVRQYVQQNPKMFKGKVYGPIAVEIITSRPEHAKIAEHVIPANILRAFCVEYDCDQQTILDVGAVDVFTLPNSANFDHPVPLNEVQSYGVVSYLDQLLEMPGPVRLVLCTWADIHRIAVGKSGIDYEKIFASTLLKSIVTESQFFRGRRSQYTNQLSTSAVFIRNPRILGHDTVSEEVKRLDKQINDLQIQLNNLTPNIQNLQKEEEQTVQLMNPLKDKKTQLRSEQRARETAISKLRSTQNRLQELEQRPSYQTQIEKFKRDAARLGRQRADLASLIQKAFTDWKNILFEIDSSIILKNLFTIKYEKSHQTVLKLQEELKVLQNEYQQVEQKLNSTKDLFQKKKTEAQQIFGGPLTNEAQIEVLKWERENNLTQNEIVELRAKVETKELEISAMCVDDSAISRYEAAKLQLQKLEKEISSLVNRLESRDTEVQKKKNVWLTKLKDAINRIDCFFGVLFTKMGFVGQVKLYEDRLDFSKYELHIIVKFHEEHSLRRLVSTSQSGGEQSVSTAAFLIALQQLDSAPFRLVDEINQGMDSSNERKIIKLIIAASSPLQNLFGSEIPDEYLSENNSFSTGNQYFMITPKLLSGLEFDESVAVHVIFNGPHTPNSVEWKNSLRSRVGITNQA